MKLLLLAMLLELAGQTTTNIGTIEGSVTLYPSAAPIPNSRIFLSPQGGGARGLQTTTDASGRFSFKEVPAGRYVVSANAQGYARSYKGGYSKDVNVTDNGQTQTVELTLVRMGTVKGRVYDRDGNPASNIGIMGNPAMHVRDEVWVPGGSASPFYGSTNANGEYEAHNVEPGEYYITAAPKESRSGLEVTYYPARQFPLTPNP